MGRGFAKLVAPKASRRLVIPVTKLPNVKQEERKVWQQAAGGWLALQLEEHYKDRRPVWGPPRDVQKGWKPSSLGKACDRELVAEVLGYQERIPPKLRRIFDMGIDIEKRWLERFTKFGILLAAGTKVKRELEPRIIGKLDAKVRHPYETGRVILVEIKSINRDGFRQLPPVVMDPEENVRNLMKGSGYVGARVRQYMFQHQVYMVEDQVPEGLLLFDCKDNSEYADYAVSVDPELVAEQYARLILLTGYWSRAVVPPCSHSGLKEGICGYKAAEEVPVAELHRLSEAVI